MAVLYPSQESALSTTLTSEDFVREAVTFATGRAVRVVHCPADAPGLMENESVPLEAIIPGAFPPPKVFVMEEFAIFDEMTLFHATSSPASTQMGLTRPR